jgi:hypothetical protein
MAADDNVQDKTKIMESADDKKPEEIVPLTLESILCGLNLNVNFVLLWLLLFNLMYMTFCRIFRIWNFSNIKI